MRQSFIKIITLILGSTLMYCKSRRFTPICSQLGRSRSLIGAILMSLIATLTATAQSSAPKTVIEAFYRYDQAHSQVFNRTTIDARRKWFTPELYRLFQTELKREAEYLKKNPTDKPYFGDGLPFQPLQEPCETGGGKSLGRKLSLKQDSQNGNRSVVLATFAYPKPCSDPNPVVYTIGLVRGKTGWQIDDINYGEDTTLKQRLNRKEY